MALSGTIILLGIFAAAAGAATPQEQLMAPIHAFIDGFNKGDAKAAAAALSPTDLVIIDDVPPHVWTGAHAFETWSKALDAASQAEGDTDEAVTLGKPTQVIANADRGYVVVPAVYTFKQKGVAMREVAQMVCVVQKGKGGWLVAGWSWVGSKPKPAGAAAK
jgi:hypothetical protein